MLAWAVIFFVLALVAAFLGFFAVAGTAAWIAKFSFIAFFVLTVISLMSGRSRYV